MHLLLQITITRNYKLNTSIIYTKVTNSDDIKHFLKSFTMMILKFYESSLMQKKKFITMVSRQFKRFRNKDTKIFKKFRNDVSINVS